MLDRIKLYKRLLLLSPALDIVKVLPRANTSILKNSYVITVFNQIQIQDLVQRHGMDWSTSQVEQLMSYELSYFQQ